MNRYLTRLSLLLLRMPPHRPHTMACQSWRALETSENEINTRPSSPTRCGAVRIPHGKNPRSPWHDPAHPVTRCWDIGEEQALAWVHTDRPQIGGAGGLPEAEEAAQALRAKAMAFYHEAIAARQLPG